MGLPLWQTECVRKDVFCQGECERKVVFINRTAYINGRWEEVCCLWLTVSFTVWSAASCSCSIHLDNHFNNLTFSEANLSSGFPLTTHCCCVVSKVFWEAVTFLFWLLGCLNMWLRLCNLPPCIVFREFDIFCWKKEKSRWLAGFPA